MTKGNTWWRLGSISHAHPPSAVTRAPGKDAALRGGWWERQEPSPFVAPFTPSSSPCLSFKIFFLPQNWRLKATSTFWRSNTHKAFVAVVGLSVNVLNDPGGSLTKPLYRECEINSYLTLKTSDCPWGKNLRKPTLRLPWETTHSERNNDGSQTLICFFWDVIMDISHYLGKRISTRYSETWYNCYSISRTSSSCSSNKFSDSVPS